MRRAQPRKFPLRERVMEQADDTVHHSRRLAVPRPGAPGRWSVAPLPEMPLFLRPEFYVPAPLEATYRATWDLFPIPLRGLVGG